MEARQTAGNREMKLNTSLWIEASIDLIKDAQLKANRIAMKLEERRIATSKLKYTPAMVESAIGASDHDIRQISELREYVWDRRNAAFKMFNCADSCFLANAFDEHTDAIDSLLNHAYDSFIRIAKNLRYDALHQRTTS